MSGVIAYIDTVPGVSYSNAVLAAGEARTCDLAMGSRVAWVGSEEAFDADLVYTLEDPGDSLGPGLITEIDSSQDGSGRRFSVIPAAIEIAGECVIDPGGTGVLLAKHAARFDATPDTGDDPEGPEILESEGEMYLDMPDEDDDERFRQGVLLEAVRMLGSAGSESTLRNYAIDQRIEASSGYMGTVVNDFADEICDEYFARRDKRAAKNEVLSEAERARLKDSYEAEKERMETAGLEGANA